jgi:CRP-like cAMP-binding protein
MIARRVVRLFSAVAVVVVLGNYTGNSFAADKVKPMELSKALAQATLFANLTDEERNALKSAATLRHGEAGERIIVQGKSLDRMYILLEGQADVLVNGKVVATLPGQALVGEVEFLDKLPASADVAILKEALLLELNNDEFLRLMQKHARLGYVVMSEIAKMEAQRLRAMNLK